MFALRDSSSTRRRLAAALACVLLACAAIAALVATATGADGTITTVAGTDAGFAGDGGPATQAKFRAPADIAVLADGSLLIADRGNDRIRRVAPNGNVATVAGGGDPCARAQGPCDPAQDQNQATNAALDAPSALSPTPDGGYVIADSGHDRIRKVSPSGRITTIAGTTAGFAGDGGPATSAKLDDPRDVIALHDGSFLVADTGNDRVRRIAPDGTISTLAGSQGGFRGDGGDATHARLNRPRGLAIEPSGDVLVVDQGNHRVRRISHGTIETVAGGASGFGGDLGLATSAQFDSPTAVMPLTNGGFLVADGANDRIRRVTPLGVVFTIVGSDSGLSGDGGPASQARIDAPAAIVPTGDGGFFIADAGNNRVRRVTDTGQLPAPSARRLIGVSPVNGDVRVLPQGGKRYVTLREADVTPNASFVDAKPGRIAVTADQGGGTLKTMNFYEGAFRMTQGKGAKPVTDIRLSDPLDGCLSAKRLQPGKATIAAKKRRSRHVWGNGHGRYRTKGRYASALVRGTIWRTTDVCSSTTVRVARGLVQVRDLVKKRTVFVKAGRSYTARAAKRG